MIAVILSPKRGWKRPTSFLVFNRLVENNKSRLSCQLCCEKLREAVEAMKVMPQLGRFILNCGNDIIEAAEDKNILKNRTRQCMLRPLIQIEFET